MTDASPMVATGLPPGWIEVAAFRSPGHLAAFLDAQMDADADAFDEQTRELLHTLCRRAYALLEGQGWLHAGCVVTQFPDDGSAAGGAPVTEEPYTDQTPWRTTGWTYAVGLLAHPSTGDLNPVALLERALGRLGALEIEETFRLADGRDVLAIATTTAVDPGPLTEGAELLPHFDPDALGTVVYVVPPLGLPDHLAVVVGIAPNVEERSAMSFVALEMATSVHVPDDVRQLRSEAVLVDTTGVFQPTGSMPAPVTPEWARARPASSPDAAPVTS